MPIVVMPDGKPIDIGNADPNEATEAYMAMHAQAPSVADQVARPTEQDQSWLRYPKLVGQGLVRGVTQALGLPGTLREAVGLPQTPMAAPGGTYAAPPMFAPPGKGIPLEPIYPTQSQLRDLTARAGLSDSANLQPEGLTEATIAGAGEGLGGVLGAGAMGVPLGPTDVLAGTAGGAAGSAAAEAMPGNGIAPIAAGALASGGIGLAGQWAEGRAALSAAEQRAEQAAKLAQAASNANYEFNPVGTKGITRQLNADIVASKAQHELLHSQIDEGVEGIRQGLGQSQDYESAGQVAQAAARRWVTGRDEAGQPVAGSFPELQARLKQELLGFTDPGLQVPRDALAAALKAQASAGGDNAALIKELAPRLPQALFNKMFPQAEGVAPLAPPRLGASPGVAEPRIMPAPAIQAPSQIGNGNSLAPGLKVINPAPAPSPIRPTGGLTPIQTEPESVRPPLGPSPKPINTDQGMANAPQDWASAAELRSRLGDIMREPSLQNTVAGKMISDLYHAQSEDMRSALAGQPNAEGAVQAFDDYNRRSAELYRLKEGPVSRLISAGSANAIDPNPGKAVESLLNTGRVDGTDLSALRAIIPDGVNELGSAFLAQKKDWGALSPSAKLALAGDPDRAAALDSAWQAKTSADAAIKQRIAELKAQASADRDTQTEADKSAKKGLMDAARYSGQDAKQAQNDLEALRAKKAVSLGDIQRTVAGTSLGAAGGVLAQHSLGEPGNDLLPGGAAGEVAGVLAPALAGAALGVGRRPLPMMLGTLGASNALTRRRPAADSIVMP